MGRGRPRKWSLAACKADALHFTFCSEWQRNSRQACMAAYRYGWIEECTAHMTKTRKPRGYWTLQRCIAEAKTFRTKQSWRLGSSSSYVTAKNRGWLNMCSEHMAGVQYCFWLVRLSWQIDGLAHAKGTFKCSLGTPIIFIQLPIQKMIRNWIPALGCVHFQRASQ